MTTITMGYHKVQPTRKEPTTMAEKMEPGSCVCRPGPPSWKGKGQGVNICYTAKGARIQGMCELTAKKTSKQGGNPGSKDKE